MFHIKLLCFDYGNPTPYEDILEFDPKFSTYKEAYDYALGYANAEVDDLNDGYDKLTSFGLVEDMDSGYGDSIRVNCYMLSSEEDTTGETEQVTVYWVEPIEEEQPSYKIGKNVLSAVEYLKLITGQDFEPADYEEGDYEFIRKTLDDIDPEYATTLWDYPLNEIDHCIKNGSNVVLVKLINKDSNEEYRWFECFKKDEVKN